MSVSWKARAVSGGWPKVLATVSRVHLSALPSPSTRHWTGVTGDVSEKKEELSPLEARATCVNGRRSVVAEEPVG